MPRTTLDIDATVLRELKKRRTAERRTLGAIASDLLAVALADTSAKPKPLAWTAKRMGAPKVDIEDKEAVRAVLGDR